MTQPLSNPAPSTQAARSAQGFARHRAALIDLYGRIPDEQGGFAAWDGGMTFVGLADHLSGALARVPAMLRGEKPQPPTPSADLPEARQKLQATLDAYTATVGALSDEDLRRRIPAFGQELPVAAVLDFITQHEAHHKGQAWMMARMIGIVPGMFVKMG